MKSPLGEKLIGFFLLFPATFVIIFYADLKDFSLSRICDARVELLSIYFLVFTFSR